MTAARFRITALRTLDDAQLLQSVEDDPDASPRERELANRLAASQPAKQIIRRLTDELDRWEIRFGPLP
jgi:hypothetical protein